MKASNSAVISLSCIQLEAHVLSEDSDCAFYEDDDNNIHFMDKSLPGNPYSDVSAYLAPSEETIGQGCFIREWDK